MNNSKKSFLGIMGLLMTTGTANAQIVDGPMMHPVQQNGEFPENVMPNMIPQMPIMQKGEPIKFLADEQKDDAVLFKVHDISPVDNKVDGAEACDFYVTFYNRSPKDINGAVLDLTWIDNSLIGVVNNERAENQDKNKGENVDANFSYTDKVHPIGLTATVDMPALKSYKQITTRSRIKTDRCFMLLEDLGLNVRSCNAKNEPSAPVGPVVGGEGSMGGNQGCNGLFRFISSKSPEYYVEFKNISYDEQKAEERQQRASEEQELESKFRTAIDSFGRLSSTLAEIK